MPRLINYPSVTLYTLSLVGVGVFAASGALAAGRKNFDWLGVVIIAGVTALGGGTVRDVLLNRHPISWIADPWQLLSVLIATVVTFIYVRFSRPPKTLLLVADAIGLAYFSLSGAQLAEEKQLHAIVIVLMGTITGSAGGLLRDVLSRDVPVLLQQGELYATTCIAGIALYLGLESVGVPKPQAALWGMATIAGLRFAAIAWRLRLPVFELKDH